jgi:serine/threonine protein kinase
MGAVYLAHDTTLDRPVALKIPKFTGKVDVAAARFLCEARAAAGLQHPNICPIYDLGDVEGTHYLAMAFVAGEPLSARVGLDRPMDTEEAARIVRQLALAMQYAHDRGVIHRDLKPANVLIDDRGEPVIMDFGLARRPNPGGPQLTVQGDIMGTPAYMPPEQVAGDVARMGPASDVYSLGVVLYELLTGGPPFRGDLFALLAQVVADPPPLPSTRRSGLAPQFDAICRKALAKKPEERWKSMRALADVLAPFAGDPPGDGARVIALRVRGTNVAYRPPSILPIVTVGRQRRKVGDSPDQGNDFVLRVAGNDTLSARISRRHFELHRIADGWAAIDRSKAGLTRNGEPVPKDTPVGLADGDELGVAGVVTLEVLIRGSGPDDWVQQAAFVEVPAPAGIGGGQVQIEASVGEMVTVD